MADRNRDLDYAKELITNAMAIGAREKGVTIRRGIRVTDILVKNYLRY